MEKTLKNEPRPISIVRDIKGVRFVNWLVSKYVSTREWSRGQTMTEYALILSAVAVVVFLGYQTMGGNISSLLTSVDSQL